ncbi:MAG: hypothetical protein ACR2QM_17470 [Longimicrobiales bacterium]
MKPFYIVAGLCSFVAGPVAAQDALEEVRLFQSFFEEGTIAPATLVNPGLTFSDFDGGSIFTVGAQAAVPLTPLFELGMDLNFASINPDGGSGDSGLTDLGVSGHYKVLDELTQVSVGGSLTLPIGSEDIGQGDVDFGMFGALRHPVRDNMALAGMVGIDFVERGSDRDAGLQVGGGLIYRTEGNINIVSELRIETEGDYAGLSGGLDYETDGGGRVRGGLLIGLDDGAPDLGLLASMLFFFR